ncbi:MAG: tetratricopeptide repeat protein [Xanthobacteraceae bacterium]
MAYAPFLAWRRRFAFGHGAIRRGGGPWGAEIQVASSTKRAPLRLIARVAGAATIIVATAAAHGDIESAISTYEQLRFYNPRLAATRYQLGVLYYQLGSYAQARGYLQTALQMPDVTPELRQKIEDLLDLVDKKLQPDQFSGFAQTGVRYQSNASLGAGSQTVLAPGGTLNNNFVAKSDWNWFGTVGLNYLHDFQTQTGETFEASVIAYDAQQFSLHQFDIVSLNFAPVRVLRFRRATSTA